MQTFIKIPTIGQYLYNPDGYTAKVVAIRRFKDVYPDPREQWLQKRTLQQQLGDDWLTLFYECDVLIEKAEEGSIYNQYVGQVEVLSWDEVQKCDLF